MSDPLPFRWWQYNRDGGMHTLCLLDIKVSEPDYTSMTAGKVITLHHHTRTSPCRCCRCLLTTAYALPLPAQLKYLPPRFMTVNVAIDQLLEVEAQRKGAVVMCTPIAPVIPLTP